MTLVQSFDELLRSEFEISDLSSCLTLKGLIETDTLYLVFKDRIVLDSSFRSLFTNLTARLRSKLGWVRNYSSCLYEEDFLPSKRAF